MNFKKSTENGQKRPKMAKYGLKTTKNTFQRSKLNFKKSTENGQKRSDMTEYGLKRQKNTFSEVKTELQEID